ncbi:YdeI/OmpD-associated family protein [Pararhodobacter zhoushanensis]|uniref:YdeI/OmpD-associated family protein n=1 Tax=Pararhodobacter zhoushanensis TaxID=2479545 RepID=A0ABT3H3K7_9RHOB|nr:YdeI/OmpD-associated family protein [Pararhodobacter zhoushanensis]MCW1934409.1 YdeI/OmpD-associated family protein [Pararhodobacter zhoushanensis]
MAMITDVEDFFTKGCGRCARFDTPECSVQLWRGGLTALRRICLDAGLQEVVKWAHPTYMHAGRNIALFGAFRGDFRLSFLNPGLLNDTEGVLEPAGPNSQTPGVMRFTDAGQVAQSEPVIRAYLRQLRDHAEAGTKPPKVTREIDMPDELTEALDADPALAEAFAALTPGRQKSYAFALNQAKQAATRRARIEKFRPHILAGKGATER